LSLIEVILLGVALSADAMSVTLANMLSHPRMSHLRALAFPLAFGFFQWLMPVIGYYAGSVVSDLLTKIAGPVTLILLGFIGGKMIWEALHEDDEEIHADKLTHIATGAIIVQAIATSIDALAVGVSFAATQTPVMINAIIIGICTFLLCVLMVFIGRKLGSQFGQKAEIVGGLVLIAIGIKAMLP